MYFIRLLICEEPPAHIQSIRLPAALPSKIPMDTLFSLLIGRCLILSFHCFAHSKSAGGKFSTAIIFLGQRHIMQGRDARRIGQAIGIQAILAHFHVHDLPNELRMGPQFQRMPEQKLQNHRASLQIRSIDMFTSYGGNAESLELILRPAGNKTGKVGHANLISAGDAHRECTPFH